jgi:hypothetical protein
MKARVVLILVVLVALVATAQAQTGELWYEDSTAMEFCAMHGLGPNFRYAEGPAMALRSCTNRVDEMVRLGTFTRANFVVGCPIHGLGPNFSYAANTEC